MARDCLWDNLSLEVWTLFAVVEAGYFLAFNIGQNEISNNPAENPHKIINF